MSKRDSSRCSGRSSCSNRGPNGEIEPVSSDFDSSDYDEEVVCLGTLIEAPPKDLHRRYFPSKVGGRPAWLIPEHLPKESELTCDCCGHLMTFLLQVRAEHQDPDDDDGFDDNSDAEEEYGTHRTIFMFACRNCKNQIKTFRCQLSEQNDYYPPCPATCRDPVMPDEFLEEKCCDACGLPCSTTVTEAEKGMKTTLAKQDGKFYCKREFHNLPVSDKSKDSEEWLRHEQCAARLVHQAEADNPAFRKRTIKNDVYFSKGTAKNMEHTEKPENISVFAEWNLDILETPESDDEDYDTPEMAHARVLAKRYEEEIKKNPEADLDESEQAFFKEHQKNILDTTNMHFSTITNRNPYQVIRYARHQPPLWFSNKNQLESSKVPKCENCGAKRTFEFQLQPGLIYLLKTEHLEYAIGAVYTCSKSCEPRDPKNPYQREFTFLQAEEQLKPEKGQ